MHVRMHVRIHIRVHVHTHTSAYTHMTHMRSLSYIYSLSCIHTPISLMHMPYIYLYVCCHNGRFGSWAVGMCLRTIRHLRVGRPRHGTGDFFFVCAISEHLRRPRISSTSSTPGVYMYIHEYIHSYTYCPRIHV